METSQKDLCAKNINPKGPQEGSKAIVRLYRPCNTYSFSFHTKRLNPYVVSDTHGSGTLYNTKKARYFLIELDKDADLILTKKNSFNVYTNDIDMTNDHHRIFNSSSKKLNLNYLIGTYLTFTFAINRQFSPDVVKKYFKRLRQLLLDKMLAIRHRLSSTSVKNKQTKTFIRFSSGPHVIYLGFYLPCGHFLPSTCCSQPAAFKVHSTRLGIKYEVTIKRYCPYKGKNNQDLKSVMEPTITLSKKGIPTSRPLYKEYKNLQFDIIQSPQQINRWNRLKQHVIKSERRVHYNKPYLLNKQIEQSFSTIAGI
ncbi:hypothetical protein RhiirB3_452481 [Rhizophagus irregularis]|nr:hypothetical protein RhiirB3_452481 [Rhizophagus irregularis]